MSDRPQPPVGSECLDRYEEGARVYYYRSGTQPRARWQSKVLLTCRTNTGKWRLAQIRSTESSGKRYVVS